MGKTGRYMGSILCGIDRRGLEMPGHYVYNKRVADLVVGDVGLCGSLARHRRAANVSRAFADEALEFGPRNERATANLAQLELFRCR